MNRNWDMINLLHTFSWEVSAILFFGGHLENGRIWSGQESFLNVCHVKNIWCKFHACIIKWSISLNLLTKQLHYYLKSYVYNKKTLFYGLHVSGPQIRVCNGILVFLFLNQNICCGYSKEPSQWDGYFEHQKDMIKLMGKKIITILGHEKFA